MNRQQYNPALHHRHSIRLPAYDYSSEGAYFVTICLQNSQPLLKHSELRTILEDIWQTFPQRFPPIQLDEYIVMPDHIHFIVWLHPDIKQRPKLSAIVGAYKSLTGRAALHYLREKGIPCGNQFWQRGYHEHVLRSEFELQQRRTYILNNPIKEALKHNRL